MIEVLKSSSNTEVNGHQEVNIPIVGVILCTEDDGYVCQISYGRHPSKQECLLTDELLSTLFASTTENVA